VTEDRKHLTDFTNGKEKCKLFIPLQFWFNRVTGLALPIINLQYSEIKVNIEFQDAEKVYNIAPTNYIQMSDDVVHYEPFEYIQQTVNNVQAAGIFTSFDFRTKRLYYLRKTRNNFLGATSPVTTFSNTLNQPYLIKGRKSKFEGMPFPNTSERTHRFNAYRNFSIKDAFLLTEYIFLDEEERVKMAQRKHEYLIEQVQFSGEKQLTSTHNKIKLALDNPTKFIVWVAQLDYLTDSTVNDTFNYTNSWEYDVNGDPVGANLVTEGTLILNGRERLSFRPSEYFSFVSANQHFSFNPSVGINIISFCLFPEQHQPSGSLNMSKIDDVLLQLTVDPQVEFKNIAKLRVYTVTYNRLRIATGIGGLVFTD
jgi:hypothetical protein